MEHRLHPWMEPSIREQIRELESDESRTRRRTIRGEANLNGIKLTKEQAAQNFREANGIKSDFDPIEQQEHDEFQETQKGHPKATGGGKPGEGACVGACIIF